MFSETDWSTVSLHRVFANRLQKVNRESWSCLLSLVSMLLLRCQLHQYQQLSSRARVRVNPRRHLRHPHSSNNRLDSWEWGPNVALPGSSAQTTSLILIRLNSFADLGRRPSVCLCACVFVYECVFYSLFIKLASFSLLGCCSGYSNCLGQTSSSKHTKVIKNTLTCFWNSYFLY